jgi:hypothetical protein
VALKQGNWAWLTAPLLDFAILEYENQNRGEEAEEEEEKRFLSTVPT